MLKIASRVTLDPLQLVQVKLARAEFAFSFSLLPDNARRGNIHTSDRSPTLVECQVDGSIPKKAPFLANVRFLKVASRVTLDPLQLVQVKLARAECLAEAGLPAEAASALAGVLSGRSTPKTTGDYAGRRYRVSRMLPVLGSNEKYFSRENTRSIKYTGSIRALFLYLLY